MTDWPAMRRSLKMFQEKRRKKNQKVIWIWYRNVWHQGTSGSPCSDDSTHIMVVLNCYGKQPKPNRVQSSPVRSSWVELRQKEPKSCNRPLPFYKPKLLIECYVNLRYKNLHSCPVNTLTLKSHRGPSGLRSFCHCVSKWIAGKPLAFFFSSQTKHTPKTLHEK